MDRELHFNALNKTSSGDMVPEYLHYSVTNKYPKIDFSQYKEILPNGVEVITINNYHRCLLDNDEEYRNFVIEDVLFDIDRYGYYATEDFEDALAVVGGLLTSDFTPDTLGQEEWFALDYISGKQDDKFRDKHRRIRKRKHE